MNSHGRLEASTAPAREAMTTNRDPQNGMLQSRLPNSSDGVAGEAPKWRRYGMGDGGGTVGEGIYQTWLETTNGSGNYHLLANTKLIGLLVRGVACYPR